MQATLTSSLKGGSAAAKKRIAFARPRNCEEGVKADLSIPNQIARAKEVQSRPSEIAVWADLLETDVVERAGLIVHANALDRQPTVRVANGARLAERTTLTADAALTIIPAHACGGQCP
jgi:hypothetical protein